MSIERTKEDQDRFHADMARIASLPVTKAIEAMERKPTAAAMRAAGALQTRLFIGKPRTHALVQDETISEIIDRETGLPELIDACKAALKAFEEHGIIQPFAPEAEQALRKAIAKAEGT